jgi:hypothetical protein
MNRRVTRGLAVLGCVVVVSAATSVIVEASTRDSKDSAGAALVASDAGLPSAEVVKYWNDTKTALSPLLLYVRLLPKAIQGIQDNKGAANDSQLNQAAVMGENFATSRDLVGRIAVPASAPAGVGELLQVACQLYRQSSLTLTELKGVPARLAVAQRAASLQVIGDRLFDQARRVLHIDAVAANQAPVEYRYAPPVPALVDLTGTAAQPGDAANVDEALRSARLLIERASTGRSEAPAASFRALQGVAGGLETDSVGQGEDVIGARLAIALALRAEGAKVDGQSPSADSLLMLSNDVWNQSRTLSPAPHPALTMLNAPKRDRSQVWTGGDFNGKPPALAPGQDVGSGVPGGLPKLDPAQILKG